MPHYKHTSLQSHHLMVPKGVTIEGVDCIQNIGTLKFDCNGLQKIKFSEEATEDHEYQNETVALFNDKENVKI